MGLIKNQYKYDEDRLINQIKYYIDSTYDQHYSSGNIQTTEYIIDQGLGQDFCLANIIKYASRFGKKDGKNRKDLFKIIHYALIAIYVHDKEVITSERKKLIANFSEDNLPIG